MSKMKRTYSRRTMSIAPANQDNSAPEPGKKRRRIPTSGRITSSSFSEDDNAASKESLSPDKDTFQERSELSAALPEPRNSKWTFENGDFRPQPSGQSANSSLHGQGVKAFRESLQKSNPNNATPTNSPQGVFLDQALGKMTSEMQTIGTALWNKAKTGSSTSVQGSFRASQSSSSMESTRYQPKPYTADKSRTPQETIFKTPLTVGGIEAILWNVNQSSSPFLHLPAEVRNLVYELVFGKGQILVNYQTYQWVTKAIGGKESYELVKVFKYRYTVYPMSADLINGTHIKGIAASKVFTPMNLVCRQLWYETATLPFKLNRWLFTTHQLMMNFLWFEKKLQRHQRRSMATMFVASQLPSKTMVQWMGGLKKIYLVEGIFEQHSGWYEVKEGEKGIELVWKVGYFD
ncbi:hypothetical protein BCR34DRAFT_566509 [Clohesyomyces aquaticus]|uniref:Uncharacterized protein n=1 Tax=Clohesyomyces aquaticus TaxID=1231657 RepID=A0A1Y1ZK74_9PLEO|nr:hypothetical protein BCR34DRAFT_566509 [Clohesyomyces aquaticus]